MVKFSGIVPGAPSHIIGITFALYKDQQGSAPLWLETQSVTVDAGGHYSVQLGATLPNGLPKDLFATGEARWLGVQPEGQTEQPRVLLLSVPYALKAADAETIGGLPPSAFVLATPAVSSNGTAANAATSGNTASLAPPPGTVSGTGTANFLPIWTDSADIANSVVFQSGTGSTAKIGVNTSTPASTLDVKGTGTIRGLFSLPSVGVATAAKGSNSQPIALTASAFNSSTAAAVNENFRWQAEPASNNTATPSGTLNLLFASGTGTPIETGLKISSAGLLTFATGQTFPGAGTISGVTAGSGLTGGGTNGNVTLNLDATKIPQLNVSNTFTGNQTVSGNLSATGVVTGSSYQIGSALFAFGSVSSTNAFVGFSGNTSMTGGSNAALGNGALGVNTSGAFNVASGTSTLSSNTTGSSNTASGAAALESNTNGSNNTATGSGALISSTTGSNNTANGLNALAGNTIGANNTGDGYWALIYNSTGSNNTGLGYLAGPDQANGNLTNATAIGAFSQVTASNSLVLGSINGVNGATADTNVGIGTTAPGSRLDVHGTANFTGPVTFAAGQTFPGTGTITGVTAGTGLTGGGTTGGVTLSVDTTKVVTGVAAGTGLTGGGTGGVPTLSIDTTKVPQLAAANTFTGNQTVSGNLSATGIVSGNSFNIASNAFAFGSFANENAFLGFAGNTSGTGTANTGVGPNALAAVTAGSGNTAVGTESLLSDTAGLDNTATGAAALRFNTTGNANTATGWSALTSNLTGGYNTATGIQALAANTNGSFNTAAGDAALGANTTGISNTATGNLALRFNATGSYNTATGDSALENTTTSYDTADGYSALKANTTGGYNTATGYLALTANTTGSYNVAAGAGALGANTTGSGNVAVGFQPLNTSSVGSNNTAVGNSPLFKLSSGDGNTMVGNGAFYWLLSGSYNTAIGFNAGTLNINQTSFTNATAIGAFSEVEADNSLVLGSIAGTNGAGADTKVGIGITAPSYRLHVGTTTGVGAFRVEGPGTAGSGFAAASFGGYGNFVIDAPGIGGGRFVVQEGGRVGIGTPTPDALLSVNGTADKIGGGSWGTFSDRRLKDLDGDFSAGLSEILKLHPIRYRYKDDNGMGILDRDQHIGFVAQEVQKVIPEAVTQNDKGYLLVNNDPILWTMLNAIKEQQRQITELRSKVDVLETALRTTRTKSAKAKQSSARPHAQLSARSEFVAAR